MIQVRVDDLAYVGGDAVAWPVNADLRPMTPLLRRLEVAGGRALASQLRTQDPLPVGSAVVTGAGDLSVELMVSAVIASDGEPVAPSGVRRALTSALHRAADWQIAHLVCTPFGLGAGNLDIDESAEIMLDVLTRHLAQSRFPSAVTIVVETAVEAESFSARLARSAR